MAAQVLYLFAPLLVSAVLAAFVHRYELFRVLAKPIDAGAVLRGQRALNDGKTWRGDFVAVVGSIATVLLQKHVIGTIAPCARLGSTAAASAGVCRNVARCAGGRVEACRVESPQSSASRSS